MPVKATLPKGKEDSVWSFHEMRMRNVNALTLGRWRIMPASEQLKQAAKRRGNELAVESVQDVEVVRVDLAAEDRVRGEQLIVGAEGRAAAAVGCRGMCRAAFERARFPARE